ncbi:MAG TPA: metallophosphoesterase [Polyangia bacterium]
MSQPIRPRRNLRRFRIIVLAVVVAVEAPGVALLAHLLGNSALAIVLAALVSTPYLLGLRDPFDDPPKSVWLRYFGLWPFFAWWTGCLVFLFLAPIAIAIAAIGGWPIYTALFVAGAAALVSGVRATYREPRVRKIEVAIAGLPRAFDRYRIAHLSDVHCGSFTPAGRVARWVARINRLGADLVAVTGDLITSGERWVDPVAEALAGLRGADGVYACMGNHDYFVHRRAPGMQSDEERAGIPEVAAALERRGIPVLLNRGITVDKEGALLYVAGVDDTWTGRDDVEAALAGRPEGAATVLLAHDPNLFPQAVAKGVELTLSGHTHGGQLAVPLWSRRLTLARLVTRFTAGLYQMGRSALYVNRGAGTTGPPIRLGARAEIVLIVLRAA